MPNRLAGSTSPYLLQHADNPVDWYPWGAEAFEEAARREVPVLLSVGYAACHWCHVMAHESFEDPDTASVMNELFVNVKVDREERPDVDRIYMDAVQALNGHGGWPMTVFLNPDGRPFFAGTYFPKADRPGHPAFVTVLRGISDAWEQRRDELEEQADRLTMAVRRALPPADVDHETMLATALADLESRFDVDNGGFGAAPKFPQAPNLELLARATAFGVSDVAASNLKVTLEKMAAGGIHDHVGGGFCRYSVDATWLVPHFEKMLYDNALLARLYLRASQLFSSDHFAQVARRSLDYMTDRLRSPGGAFFSAEDADSEGVEGKYYVWAWDELVGLVGEDMARSLGGSPEGNFEGDIIINLSDGLPGPSGTSLETALQTLAVARGPRVPPALDDKVVTAWNGLAIRAFAEAGAVLGDAAYVDIAESAADFVLTHMVPERRLARAWRNGTTSGPGYCDDYAAMAVATLTLYQVTGRARWADAGLDLVAEMRRLFGATGGGFHATGHDAEKLIHRPVNLMDNPTPSDNSLAAEALLMATALTGDTELLAVVDGIASAAGVLLQQYPSAVGHLAAVLATVPRLKEVAVIGDGDLGDVLWERFRPECVLAKGDGAATPVPLLENRPLEEDAVAYVCRGFMCDAPVHDAAALREALA
ncbi:MAG: thioredoxin domain-containing protein [Acidimicrobiia bacterium]|nr:thioredoxin domain-containing protein [Acidimicrobiia bacterium]